MDFRLEDKDEFLAVSYRNLSDLDWNMVDVSKEELVAHIKVSIRSAGEEIRGIFNTGKPKIISECNGIHPDGFGKNKSNI